MTEIQPFTFPTTGQSVRTLLVDGEPMVCHVDVCTLLQHSNPSVAIQMVDADDRRLIDLSESDIHALKRGVPGNGRTWFLTESGFYTLALSSRAPGAHALRRWVTKEVIPAIRRTGSYSITQMSRKELARMVIEAEEALEEAENRAVAAEHQVFELAPAARAWDVLASADGDYSAREAANILNRDPAIDTGQNRLLDTLREWQIIDRRDIPYATHAAHVRLRPRSYTNRATQEERAAKPQVRLTAQGIRYLHKRLGGTGDVREYIAQGGE